MNDGGLEHRTGWLTFSLAMAGIGVAVMVGFGAASSVPVWPIFVGGAATFLGLLLALAVLFRFWPFGRRPSAQEQLVLRLRTLLDRGKLLRGPIQKPPQGPPEGSPEDVAGLENEVYEVLEDHPNQLKHFKQLPMNWGSPQEKRQYERVAERVSNLIAIIDILENGPPPSPVSLPPPVVLETQRPDPRMPH